MEAARCQHERHISLCENCCRAQATCFCLSRAPRRDIWVATHLKTASNASGFHVDFDDLSVILVEKC